MKDSCIGQRRPSGSPFQMDTQSCACATFTLVLEQRVLGFLQIHDDSDAMGCLLLDLHQRSEQLYWHSRTLAAAGRAADLAHRVVVHCLHQIPAEVCRWRRANISRASSDAPKKVRCNISRGASSDRSIRMLSNRDFREGQRQSCRCDVFWTRRHHTFLSQRLCTTQCVNKCVPMTRHVQNSQSRRAQRKV